MLRTDKVFRLYDIDCAMCQVNIGQGNMFPPPAGVLLDATQDRLYDAYIMHDVGDVQRAYRDMVKRQLALWLVVAFGAIFTYACVLSFGKFFAILYILLCGLFGDHILCLPDGTAYDREHNVLYIEGYFIMYDYPETVIYVKGSRKFK